MHTGVDHKAQQRSVSRGVVAEYVDKYIVQNELEHGAGHRGYSY